MAPTAFGTLLEHVTTLPTLKEEVQKLIELKRAGAELDYGPCIPVISDFIESELIRLESNQDQYKSNAAPYDELDKIFQYALNEVWQ